jgi:hypothetical protein
MGHLAAETQFSIVSSVGREIQSNLVNLTVMPCRPRRLFPEVGSQPLRVRVTQRGCYHPRGANAFGYLLGLLIVLLGRSG